MGKLISVIVPVYNVEKYIDRCIESIVNQTYRDIELILVDDGSTDSSQELCKKWEKKDSRIKVLHKENGGVETARNYGLDNANGEYIGFIDSDDYINEKMFEVLVNNIENNDIIVCEYYTVDSSNKQHRNNFEIEKMEVVWNALYRKSIIGETRFRDLLAGEDRLFNCMIRKKTDKIKFIDKQLYYYFLSENSLVRNTKFSIKKATDGIYATYFCYRQFDDYIVQLINTMSIVMYDYYREGIKRYILKY